MSATVETVLGPVPASELGRTLVHEHLRTRHETVSTQFPHLYDDERTTALIVERLRTAREHGLDSYCDATVAGLGRDVRLMQRVARASGVRVLAGTGLYTFDTLPGYFAHRDADRLADAFVHDIAVGIQGTDARAAFIKCATDVQGITPGVEQVLRASARAHRRTGAPIVTHSVPATGNGLDQLDVFADEGVRLDAVLVGHCGDSDDVGYLERLVARGARLGMDRYGMVDRLSFERRNATVVELCRRGHSERIMLSQDHSIVRDVLYPTAVLAQRDQWSTTVVLDRVLGELVAAGVAADAVAAMVAGNVHDWLTPRQPY